MIQILRPALPETRFAICTPSGWLITLAAWVNYAVQNHTYLVRDECKHLIRGMIFSDLSNNEEHIKIIEYNEPNLFFTNEGNLSATKDNLFVIKHPNFSCRAITKKDLDNVENSANNKLPLISLFFFAFNITRPCLVVTNKDRRVEVLYPDEDIEHAFAGYDNTILVVTKTKFLILDNPLI